MFSFKNVLPFIIATAAICANAETHTVHFINNCGFGTPTLVEGTDIVSTGADFVSNGPLIAIAYLQTGACGLEGEGCTVINITLVNPTTPGTGSATFISLTPPHAFSAPSGFGYSNGCDGLGEDCTNANCPEASPTQPSPQITCEADNVNITITFCD